MAFDLPEALHLLGRFLVGGLFVLGGVKHFFIIPMMTEIMEKRGVPAAKLVLIAGSLFELVFGALLIFGLYVPLSAFCLIVFTIIATVMFFNFWDYAPGPEREGLKNALLTNFAVCGGLLLAAAGAM
jgi:putative oxidoreductase